MLKIGTKVGFYQRISYRNKKEGIRQIECEGVIKDSLKQFGGEYVIENVKMIGTISKRKVWKK